MKIEKYKNLTFNELYNLECLQNTQIKLHLIEHMNKLINAFFDVFGEIFGNDKFYFHCFVFDGFDYSSKRINIFVSLNQHDVIGCLIIDFEYGYEYLFYDRNDLTYNELFDLFNEL